MAVATLNQNYNYGHSAWHYNDGLNYTLNQSVATSKDDDLSTVLRDTMTGPISMGLDYFEFEPTCEELDPAIQELILQNETSCNNMNFDNPENFNVKQEEVDSDNESVMFYSEDLGFLDRDRSVDSDDSNCCGNNSHKLRTSSRSSIDSGYDDSIKNDSNIPRFDCLYGNKISSPTEGFYEQDDIDSKPYCKSNRGAKKNLLWKFILETLKDKKQKLISWQDEREGIFKFDDTVTFSRQWGAKKGKNDMNFEKLSRAIRHYYKNGLMSRISTERLVYKFNWKSVPLRHRRY